MKEVGEDSPFSRCVSTIMREVVKAVWKDSPVSQWVRDDWRERGLTWGLEMGSEEGQRTLVQRLVYIRFPELFALAQEQVAQVTEVEDLELLGFWLTVAHDSEAARHVLLACSTKKETDPPY